MPAARRKVPKTKRAISNSKVPNAAVRMGQVRVFIRSAATFDGRRVRRVALLLVAIKSPQWLSMGRFEGCQAARELGCDFTVSTGQLASRTTFSAVEPKTR